MGRTKRAAFSRFDDDIDDDIDFRHDLRLDA